MIVATYTITIRRPDGEVLPVDYSRLDEIIKEAQRRIGDALPQEYEAQIEAWDTEVETWYLERMARAIAAAPSWPAKPDEAQ